MSQTVLPTPARAIALMLCAVFFLLVRTSLLYTALVGGLLMTFTAPLYWVWPDPQSAALMVAIALFGTAGQLLLIFAFSQAEAGLLAPFGYSLLIFATLLGFLAFAEMPEPLTLLGALVIVVAGLYVWWRETRLHSVRYTAIPGP